LSRPSLKLGTHSTIFCMVVFSWFERNILADRLNLTGLHNL
jgi:hypothetical protein